MPKHIFEHEKTEKSSNRTRVLQALLCFVGRETALEVVSGTASLTKWGVLNRLMDEGFQVIGSDKRFTIDTGCGILELDTNHWELSFDDYSFESYFFKRAAHLEDLMSKTHFFNMKKATESSATESATA